MYDATQETNSLPESGHGLSSNTLDSIWPSKRSAPPTMPLKRSKVILNKPDFLSNLEEDLSETDTRIKLIDPLFKTVLGWKEADIRREEAASDGFADYTFGTDYKWFHVEAKRLVPRFEMHAKSEARKLKLTGCISLEIKM